MTSSRLIVLAIAAMSLTAVAGKLERDELTKDVLPAVADAQTAFQTSCGCPLKINVDDVSLSTKTQLIAARNVARHITEDVPKYCTDAASRKAVCKMTTLDIAYAKPASFTFSNGVGKCMTDGQVVCTWDQIARTIDK